MPPQPQAMGAIPLVLHAQLAGLRARHNVTLVTIIDGPGEAAAVQRLRADGVAVHAVQLFESAGVARWKRRWRLADTWLRGRYPWRTAWFWAPHLQPLLDQVFAAQTFDIVHVEDNAMGFYRYASNTPVVLTEHEVRQPRPIPWRSLSQARSRKQIIHELDWQRWTVYQRRVWGRFARIQTFTAHDAAALRGIAPELASRVRVNPFGIDLPHVPTFAHGEEPDTLLFVGNFTHYPNVDAALWLGREIMPRLRAIRSGACLNIVGIAAPDTVQALACDDIAVLGAVPEIEPYMARAAVVLAPVRVGGGMRMKVLQAMATAKAVVTTTRGAEGLALFGAPPLLHADDATEFARAIATLLDAADLRQELGQQARAFVATHYTPEANTRRVEQMYAELLRDQPHVSR